MEIGFNEWLQFVNEKSHFVEKLNNFHTRCTST